MSIINFEGTTPEVYASKMSFGFYAIYLKDVRCGDIRYGRNTYDYQDRTLVFVAPGQVINVSIDTDYKPQGYAMLCFAFPSRSDPWHTLSEKERRTYCAEQLHLSANYFGDMVKKETGKTALEYIQLKVMDMAKERILDVNRSISEISYELGFKYPQHFTRAFKKSTGYSPNEYRSLN